MTTNSLHAQRPATGLGLLICWAAYGLLVTGLLMTLAYHDDIDCWLNPGTDYCLGCLDDCMDPEPTKEGV